MARVTIPDPATKPAGRRERNRRLRYRRYLDAGMHIATTDGVKSLTMQRLAADLGCAVGTVYTYFPSKGALLAELQREAVERLSVSYRLIRLRSDAELRDLGGRAGGFDRPARRVRALLDRHGRDVPRRGEAAATC